jgi:hypothetical protein
MVPTDDDDVEVIRERRRDFGDQVVYIRVLRVLQSEKFPDGVKYTFHYGEKNADHPIIRYDNHHGVHERHEGDFVEEIDFPGYEQLFRQFIDDLPDEHTPETN